LTKQTRIRGNFEQHGVFKVRGVSAVACDGEYGVQVGRGVMAAVFADGFVGQNNTYGGMASIRFYPLRPIAALPDFLIEKELAAGTLVALMKSYPLPEAGLHIVRPPGHYPARKVRVLTELLMIEHFG
jgi:hypothetical protein